MEYNNASNIVIGDIIAVVSEALTGGIKKWIQGVCFGKYFDLFCKQ